MAYVSLSMHFSAVCIQHYCVRENTKKIILMRVRSEWHKMAKNRKIEKKAKTRRNEFENGQASERAEIKTEHKYSAELLING